MYLPRRRRRPEATGRGEGELPRRLSRLVSLLCVATYRVLRRAQVEGEDPLMMAWSVAKKQCRYQTVFNGRSTSHRLVVCNRRSAIAMFDSVAGSALLRKAVELTTCVVYPCLHRVSVDIHVSDARCKWVVLNSAWA